MDKEKEVGTGQIMENKWSAFVGKMGADFLWKFFKILKHKKKQGVPTLLISERLNLELRKIKLFIYTTESLILAQDER